MKEKIYHMKLSQFLKDNGMYESFIRNFNKEKFNNLIKYSESKSVKIVNSFSWKDTKEGVDLWNKLDDKLSNLGKTYIIDYDMDWLNNDGNTKPNVQVLSNNNGYEAFYLNNELIEEGNPLNEGQERVLYFIDICGKYTLNIKDIKFGYSDCEEFPISLLELDDINWEN